jgi:hypothetical protein
MSTASDLAARDLRVLWHPCPPTMDHEWLPMVPIERNRASAGHLGESCAALENEALPRPIGKVVQFTAPCVIEPEQIDRLVATARTGIEIARCD